MSTPLAPLTFPLHGTRLIEASAGTGKTYTLTSLYLRLVLGHRLDRSRGRELLPPEILVITFTNSATEELRDRIRQRLREAVECFAERKPPRDDDSFMRGLLEDYAPGERRAAADRLETAAQWMDEAGIHTIHAFSYRMLRQHAFDSGSLFDLNQIEDESELEKEVVQDYWRRFVYPLDNDGLDVLRRALTPKQETSTPTPSDLLAGVRPLLRDIEHLPRPGADDLAVILSEADRDRQQALAELKARWQRHVAELRTHFRKAWEQGTLSVRKPSTRNKIEEWLTAIEQWAGDPDSVTISLTGTARKSLTPEAVRRHASGDVDAIATHPALEELALLDNVGAQLPPLRKPIVIHAAHWISQRLRHIKSDRGLLGFQDMLTQLDDALHRAGGDELAKTIRQQYPVALIDEFQDTDPVQYRALAGIYGHSSALGWFMIGDPKQAIYGFRGADVYTYLRAKERAEGGTYTLPRNQRSAPALVYAVNALFGGRETEPGDAFLLDQRIPFDPVEAAGAIPTFRVRGQQQAGMTLWYHAAEGDDPSLAKGAYRDAMAARAATHMVELLHHAAAGDAGFDTDHGHEPVRPGDIAVLVRDRQEAEAMQRALARRGLQSVYQSGHDSVFDTSEATDVLRWLKAAAHPNDEASVRAALATATLGLTWSDLDALAADEQRWEEALEQFGGYQTLWRTQGILPMLRHLLHDHDLPARLLASGDERGLTNLLHLAELLQEAASTRDGELALVRWLETQITEDNAGGDSAVLRLESDADRIQVSTIHKAKGLEYPLVYLPFVCTFRAIDGSKPPVRYHDASGEAQLDLEAASSSVDRADRERLAEDLRLLYVATTRAKHACWLGIAPMRSGPGKSRTDLDCTAIGHLVGRDQRITPDNLRSLLGAVADDSDGIALTNAPAPNDARAPATGEPTDSLPAARTYSGPRAQRWWIASYSAIRPEATAVSSAEPLDVRDEIIAEAASSADESDAMAAASGPHAFARGAATGTFLHGVLETAAGEGFADAVAAADGAVNRLLAGPALPERWHEHSSELRSWLQAIIQTPLPLGDKEAALAEVPAASCRPEMGFMFPAHHVDASTIDTLVSRSIQPDEPRPALPEEQLNGMLKGFIDLVFAHNGRYYLIDYKSDWLGPDDSAYDAFHLRRKMLGARQDVQYSFYFLALHRFLRLRLGDDYEPARHLGGGGFLYLRGIGNPTTHGAHLEPPPIELLERLDTLFRAGYEDVA